jgi:hypothetical protein
MNSREFRYVIFTLTTHKLCTDFFFQASMLFVCCVHIGWRLVLLQH